MTSATTGARYLRIAAAAAGIALAGCSNSPTFGTLGYDQIAPSLAALGSGRAAQAERLRPTPGFPGLDPAVIAGVTMPLMGAYLESLQAVSALSPAASNGPVDTWQTSDQVMMSFVGGGVLVSSRGLAGDLHAADASQTAALIGAGRGGAAQRRHVYLDGVFARQTVTLTCTVEPSGAETLRLNGRAHATLRFDETCSDGAGLRVVNRYWRDARGPTIRQSSQWIGPIAGTIHLQRLND